MVGKMRRTKKKKMRKMQKSKAFCQRQHARKRFKERFDIDFTNAMRDEFVFAVQNGRATHVEKQSHRIGLWRFYYMRLSKLFYFIYDNNTHNIVTVLPEGETVLKKNIDYETEETIEDFENEIENGEEEV